MNRFRFLFISHKYKINSFLVFFFRVAKSLLLLAGLLYCHDQESPHSESNRFFLSFRCPRTSFRETFFAMTGSLTTTSKEARTSPECVAERWRWNMRRRERNNNNSEMRNSSRSKAKAQPSGNFIIINGNKISAAASSQPSKRARENSSLKMFKVKRNKMKYRDDSRSGKMMQTSLSLAEFYSKTHTRLLIIEMRIDGGEACNMKTHSALLN